MKKYYTMITVGAFAIAISISTTFAMLSQTQMEVIDTAANKIVTILEKEDISMNTFLMILEKFEDRLEGQEMKLMILEGLRVATLDTYYGVEDFSGCISYYDGCNTCGVEDGAITFCTEVACIQQDTPACNQYEGQDAVTDQEIGCNQAGGQFNSLYNECEEIDPLTCNSLGGTFDECASACRHQPEGSICTMQCVPVCDFNGGGDEEALIEAQMELDAAMSRWKAQELTEYTLTQQLSCFCMREYTRPIMYPVVGNQVGTAYARYTDESQESIDLNNSPELLTIEGAFTLIQEAIDQQAASITVEYNEELGYPTAISIDYNEMIADEEAYYTFEIIN